MRAEPVAVAPEVSKTQSPVPHAQVSCHCINAGKPAYLIIIIRLQAFIPFDLHRPCTLSPRSDSFLCITHPILNSQFPIRAFNPPTSNDEDIIMQTLSQPAATGSCHPNRSPEAHNLSPIPLRRTYPSFVLPLLFRNQGATPKRNRTSHGAEILLTCLFSHRRNL